MKSSFFAVLIIVLGTTFTATRADDMTAYCQAATSSIPEAIAAHKAGTPESVFLAAQGNNATDDIEVTMVHLAYQWSDIPADMLRANAIKACVTTDGWAHCKLSPKTGLECVPSGN
jgi:hypothetical protein